MEIRIYVLINNAKNEQKWFWTQDNNLFFSNFSLVTLHSIEDSFWWYYQMPPCPTHLNLGRKWPYHTENGLFWHELGYIWVNFDDYYILLYFYDTKIDSDVGLKSPEKIDNTYGDIFIFGHSIFLITDLQHYFRCLPYRLTRVPCVLQKLLKLLFVWWPDVIFGHPSHGGTIRPWPIYQSKNLSNTD